MSADGKSATCIVSVSGTSDFYEDTSEPYIYSNYSIIQLTPGNSEQINVSLYNGTAADIDGYTWTIDNPAICNINATGQYCTVSAKTEGYARIKITHSKSVYPYYIGVYVLNDISNISYITTSQNILSLNKAEGSKNVKVEMVKPTNENYKSTFNWEILEGAECISILSSNEQAAVTPLKSGVATIRVTNTAAGAIYPLDINVRVIEIVDNVYIDVDTVVTLTGEETQTLTAKLVGIKENAEYSNDDFVWNFENPDQNICIGNNFSNTFSLSGLKNGSTTLYVSHPKAEYRRQILVIAEGQKSDSIDSSCYITTSQNYIKTKVGAEDTLVNLILKGGTQADQNQFKFTVKSTPLNGNGDVIKITTANGTVESKAAAQTLISGTFNITPLEEGEAVITVTNPKSYYPLEILVKVLSKNALLTEPLYLVGESIVTFLNSESKNYTINLSGQNKELDDENKISWSCDNSNINCSANGNKAILSSSTTGNTISHLSISHPKVENPKDVLVITADTEEELKNIKVFYANKLYLGLNVGDTSYCYVQTYGYNEESEFNGIAWTSDKPEVATVEFESTEPLKGIVKGISPGTAHITCKYYEESISYTVTVYPEGYVVDTLEKVSFLSTTQNVVNLPSAGLSKTVKITATGLSNSEKASLVWKIEDSTVARLNANGLSGSITALKDGETVVTVSHPNSENTLKIYVRIGSEYVMSTTPVTYIATNTDIVAIVKDAAQYELSAYLVKTTGIENTAYSFSFSIDNDSIASISPLASGKCYIKPKQAGQTEITISHPDAEYDKKVLVVIGNTEEELAAFRYITTSTNVVSVGQGSNKSVNVSLMNSTEAVVTGYTYESENPAIANIVSQSGNTFIVKGNEIGTTRIKVANTNCSYPLYIIVQVVDPIAASACPYIQVTQPVLNLIESTSWSTVTAELVGGTPDDQKNILWTSSDNTILEAYGQNGVGKVRAKTSGICYLTVSHPKAPYDQRILCICDKAASRDYSISLSSSNILSIKPNAGDQAITATLVNGTEADKNNFNWSLDVYNIVTLTYSGNQAVITPLQEGTCNLTVSHPKAPYDQKIVIKVQSFDSFNFAATNKTIVAGTTNFINMQVPASSVKTHIVYSSSNEKICTISGTTSVAQLTGIASGTCTVKAQLIATATNVVQAESDMLVYVSPADTDAVYISGSPTVYTIEMGEQKTLSAIVTGNGITTNDYYNLKWKSNNPEIVEILGASTTGSVMGSQVYALGKKPGEALITISHEKTDTELIYYVIVPGTESSKITLNKSYITLNKSETSTLRATITGGSTSDYQNIIWTAEKNDGVEICRVMGYGQEVTIYGINSGSTDVIATLPNGSTTKCQVVVEATKEVRFDLTTLRIQPGQTKTVKYHVSPATAGLSWVQTDDSYFTFVDRGLTNSAEGEGILEVTGIKEGNSSLKVASSYGNTANLQIVCNWDYTFQIDRTSISGTPDDIITINYTVNPANAKIEIDKSELINIQQYQNADGTGKLIFTPKKEGTETLNLKAINVNLGNQSVFDSKAINIKLNYDLKFKTYILSKVGNFSSIDDDNNIYIGDGETVYLSSKVIDSQAGKADYSINSITFKPNYGIKETEITGTAVSDYPGNTGTNAEVLEIKHLKDTQDYEWEFTHEIDSINGLSWSQIDDWVEYVPDKFGDYYYTVWTPFMSEVIAQNGTRGYGSNGQNYKIDYQGGTILRTYYDLGYKIYKSKKIFNNKTITETAIGPMLKGYSESSNTRPLWYGETSDPSLDGTFSSEDWYSWMWGGSSGTYYFYHINGKKYRISDGQVGYINNTPSLTEPKYFYKVEKGDEKIILFGSVFEIEDSELVPHFTQLPSPAYYSKGIVNGNSLLQLNPYKQKVISINTDTICADKIAGSVEVTYFHNGKQGKMIFPVYIQYRNCSITGRRDVFVE